jgi:hypothetical protein
LDKEELITGQDAVKVDWDQIMKVPECQKKAFFCRKTG